MISLISKLHAVVIIQIVYERVGKKIDSIFFAQLIFVDVLFIHVKPDLLLLSLTCKYLKKIKRIILSTFYSLSCFSQPLSTRRSEHDKVYKSVKDVWHREYRRMVCSLGSCYLALWVTYIHINPRSPPPSPTRVFEMWNNSLYRFFTLGFVCLVEWQIKSNLR